MSYLNFDGLALGNFGSLTATAQNGNLVGLTTTGDARVAAGSVGGLYAAPWVSGNNNVNFESPATSGFADQTHYLSTGIGSITLDFGSPQNYLGLLWGSIDAYNSLSFYNGSGGLIGRITGDQVQAGANGARGATGSLYVNIDSTTAFKSVVASSSQNAFEFDNVAYGVPEGGSVTGVFGVVLAGFAAVGVRRR
jgi:hypothetical protein